MYQRAAWSLSCAFHGRRPKHGPNGAFEELTRAEQRLAMERPMLARRFATVEFRGDWAYHVQTYGFTRHWKRGRICHRCNAARLPAYGQLFSKFGAPWTRLSNVQSILQCMPATPSPLILAPGISRGYGEPELIIRKCPP